MVNMIDLRIRDCFLAAIIVALCLLLSFPLFDYWYLSILSYAIFAFFYINLGQKRSLKKIKVFFIFSLLFWFIKRSIMFISVFNTASNYFQNNTQGTIFTLLLFLILSVYSAILSTFTLAIIQIVKQRYAQFILIIISLVVTAELNNIYLPLPAENIVLQNDFLRASLNILNPYYYKFGFYLSALLLALSFGSLKKTAQSLGLITVWVFISACVGYFAMKSETNHPANKMNIILVQSHQSVLTPSSYTIKDYFEMVDKEIERKFPSEKEVYIFWPESFMEENENNMSLLSYYQKKSTVKQIHIIGTFVFSEKGIINKMILVSPDGKIRSEYFKNHLFPIGEKSINIPFMPSSWSKTNIPVIEFSRVNSLEYEDKTFLPLICYESVINSHYTALENLKKNDHLNIMVNISKDSFYENTTLIKLHSLYSSIKASTLKTPMIRVSTTEGSEILSSSGIRLAGSRPGTMNIVSYVLK